MYHIRFTPTAGDDLARLDKSVAQRILTKIRWLAEHMETITPEPLAGQWSDTFKLRVGDYRVLYTFVTAENTITIHFVRHRREVYKAI